MTKILPLLSVLLLLATPAGAQMVLVLDDFTAGTQPREGAATGTWVGQVTQNATTISINGTAGSGSWGAFNLVPTFSAVGMNSIAITGHLDPGSTAPSFSVVFFDTDLGSQSFTVAAGLFPTEFTTTVGVPIGAWVTADPTKLNGWAISGSDTIHMTLDQIALTSPIPEPGTYAALAGVLALGFAAWRRRK
ncbi:MAG: PEP-CTERM sorting domain-containing protein [Verrucomicrobia bacterium]|nr:PEP-CTERM sorting domain-containing protein [Verrucomicrobiota bacterium]